MYQLIVLKYSIKNLKDNIFNNNNKVVFYLFCFEDFRYDDTIMLKTLLLNKVYLFVKGLNSFLKFKNLMSSKFIIYMTDEIFLKNYDFYFLYFKNYLNLNYVNNLSKKYKTRLFSLKFVYLILYENFFTYEYIYKFLIFYKKLKIINMFSIIKLLYFYFFFFFFFLVKNMFFFFKLNNLIKLKK